MLLILLGLSLQILAQGPGWVRQYTATNYVNPFKMTADDQGHIWVTGYFGNSVDFDPGPGTHVLNTPNSAQDGFVTKMDTSGNLIWAKAFNGNSTLIPTCVATDSAENVYVAGFFSGTPDFDPGGGQFFLSASPANTGAFFLKLDRNGRFLWANKLEVNDNARIYALDIGPNGEIFLGGYFSDSLDVDPAIGSAQHIVAAPG